jgi:hypothetical protein
MMIMMRMRMIMMTITLIAMMIPRCRFCLICNYVSKIIPALQSRCTRFRFAPLRAEHVRDRVDYVIAREGYALITRDLVMRPPGCAGVWGVIGLIWNFLFEPRLPSSMEAP